MRGTQEKECACSPAQSQGNAHSLRGLTHTLVWHKVCAAWLAPHCVPGSGSSHSPGACHSPRRALVWARPHCSAPTWCGTAPLWHSACTSRGRRLPQLWTGCRRTQPTAPRCSWGRRGRVSAWRLGVWREALPAPALTAVG